MKQPIDENLVICKGCSRHLVEDGRDYCFIKKKVLLVTLGKHIVVECDIKNMVDVEECQSQK